MADVLLNSLATALVHGNLQEYCWPMEALEAVHLSQTTGLSLSGRHMKEFTLYAGWQDHVSSKLAVVIAYSRNACMVLLLAQVPPPPLPQTPLTQQSKDSLLLAAEDHCSIDDSVNTGLRVIEGAGPGFLQRRGQHGVRQDAQPAREEC